MKSITKKLLAGLLGTAMTLSLAACGGGSSNAGASSAAAASTAASNSGKTYKVGIVQYVSHASLDQISDNIKSELDAKGKELGVTFDYEPYFQNGEGDATVINQIATDLIADNVDIIVPIATPAAVVMQTATEDNKIPVVFSAVSDPVSAKLVKSMDAPGGNITGTSDALASLIIGETLLGRGSIPVRIVGVIFGSCLYRVIVAIAMRFNLPASALKLVSALIVAIAIASPTLRQLVGFQKLKWKRKAQYGGKKEKAAAGTEKEEK